MVEVELTLKQFFISSAAYHGGDFNGVCCWRLVKSAEEITTQVEKLLVLKHDPSCEVTVIEEKVQTLEWTLGLLDAAFAYLNINHPTEEEETKAEEAVKALANHWKDRLKCVSNGAYNGEAH